MWIKDLPVSTKVDIADISLSFFSFVASLMNSFPSSNRNLADALHRIAHLIQDEECVSHSAFHISSVQLGLAAEPFVFPALSHVRMHAATAIFVTV